eukprot:6020052-Pleurochrysis_carterae.AAC.1
MSMKESILRSVEEAGSFVAKPAIGEKVGLGASVLERSTSKAEIDRTRVVDAARKRSVFCDVGAGGGEGGRGGRGVDGGGGGSGGRGLERRESDACGVKGKQEVPGSPGSRRGSCVSVRPSETSPQRRLLPPTMERRQSAMSNGGRRSGRDETCKFAQAANGTKGPSNGNKCVPDEATAEMILNSAPRSLYGITEKVHPRTLLVATSAARLHRGPAMTPVPVSTGSYGSTVNSFPSGGGLKLARKGGGRSAPHLTRMPKLKAASSNLPATWLVSGHLSGKMSSELSPDEVKALLRAAEERLHECTEDAAEVETEASKLKAACGAAVEAEEQRAAFDQAQRLQERESASAQRHAKAS